MLDGHDVFMKQKERSSVCGPANALCMELPNCLHVVIIVKRSNVVKNPVVHTNNHTSHDVGDEVNELGLQRVGTSEDGV